MSTPPGESEQELPREEQEQAEAGLPKSVEPGEPLSAPGPESADEPDPASGTADSPPPPPSDDQRSNAMVAVPETSPYPMRFDVAYPERLSRWKTFFRGLLIIPAQLFSVLVAYLIYFAFPIGWTTVFWRRKYPLWLFHGLSGALDYHARLSSYALLLTDQYPSFSRDESPVRLDYDEPPSGMLSRWRVFFWKALLLIPSMIALSFLMLAVLLVTAIAWFAILFTGRYPYGMFGFVVGVQRWYYRAAGYFASFNDRFPPYSLSEASGPANHSTAVASGIGGWALGGGFAALVVAAVVLSGDPITQQVNYQSLAAGRGAPPIYIEADFSDDGFIGISLDLAVDPGQGLVPILTPGLGERVVVFEWSLLNASDRGAEVGHRPVRLKYELREDGHDLHRTVAAQIVTIGSRSAPATVVSGGAASMHAVFVIPEDAEPEELLIRGGFSGFGGITYRFE